MIETLVLPQVLRDQIVREASVAHPKECCGLIEGSSSKGEIHAHACHPARNVATGTDRFEVDPARHIALLRDLRGTGHSIVGCYHSHPNGRPEPSPRDLESAADEDFIWLIEAGGTLAAFLYRARAFRQLHLA